MLKRCLNDSLYMKGQYMKLIIASNNEGKIKEFKKMLTPLGYEPVSMREAGINIDIAEDGTTFSENAHIKAKTCGRQRTFDRILRRCAGHLFGKIRRRERNERGQDKQGTR